MTGLFNTFISFFSFKFVVSAFIVGTLVALSASLLGVTLVLRKFSMIGDGLSHVAFGALALSVVLGASPLAFSLPFVVVAAVLLLRASENARIGGDAAIAMVSTASLAAGVIAISLSTGMNADVNSYLFGSLIALEKGDLVLSAVISLAVVVFYILFFNRIFALTFDESFAAAMGIRAGLYKTATAIVTAVTIAVGMRVIGAMLISALIIFPALTAMRLLKSFRGVSICAAVLSVINAFLGITLSCLFSLPTGAAIVAVNAAAFCLFWIISIVLRFAGGVKR
ncbi:MAG: metal ABC transporter permease [Clostridia bacterium]|nr:metal ABC transporter permease [Clostridia bacterium]